MPGRSRRGGAHYFFSSHVSRDVWYAFSLSFMVDSFCWRVLLYRSDEPRFLVETFEMTLVFRRRMHHNRIKKQSNKHLDRIISEGAGSW